MSESRDELHQLIDSLPDVQVEQVLTEVRRRTGLREATTDEPFAWVGSFSGPSDLSTAPTHLEDFGRS